MRLAVKLPDPLKIVPLGLMMPCTVAPFIAFAMAVKLAFTWLELIVVPGEKVFGMVTEAYEITAMHKNAKVSISTTCLNENLFLLKYDIVPPFSSIG